MKPGKSAVPFLIGLWALVFFIGCTVIAFNRGNVSTTESDSHDADGTNRASTFDVNISPK